MKKIIITLTFILLVCIAFAQGITGDWYGTLNIPGGATLHVVFHITKGGDTYTTTFDSPDQGAKGLATDKTTFTGNQLTIEATQFNFKYIGDYKPDSNKISGTFTQGGGSVPLTLTYGKPSAAIGSLIRPQDPKDFPYKQEEVTFTNPRAGNILAGTLTMPSDGKASKIVVLITGSGPQNRNEEIIQFNHRPFLVWSDWLTRQGIAVLRYDDRGIAHSTGNFATATTADFADDAEAAVNYIRSRADLKNLKIGLMGHSEGGMVAPIVASRNKEIKFIILLAGPGVPIDHLMLKQVADQMRLGGAPPKAIERSSATNRKIYKLISQNPSLSSAQLKLQVDTLLYQELRTYPKTDLQNQSIDAIVKQSAVLTSPWYRYFIAFNPADFLTKVKCPVLALDGTLDMQVNSEDNLAAIKASLEKGGNKYFQTVSMPGLNHMFQKATTGSVPEYAQILETVDPAALEKVSAWINQR
ncbi:MAG: alpha/beta hydrolase [Bacteroidota bacterium]|nr:alpha/beta hydrolase [Bacteroidota bacterium]